MQEKKPVILMVPVNLRKIFPSDSMLNFFGYIEPGYQLEKGKIRLKMYWKQLRYIFGRICLKNMWQAR